MGNTLFKLVTSNRFLRLNLLVLPYASYISLVGLGSMMVALLGRSLPHSKDESPPLELAQWLHKGLLMLTVLMVLSAAMAYNRGEAFLQLTNFVPFFVLFGVLPRMMRSLHTLEAIAIALVMGSIPISLLAMVEYVLKATWLPASLSRTAFITWVRTAPHKGRAMVMFDHPNALASYLVLVVGLGLGLILHRWLNARQSDAEQLQPTISVLIAAVALLLAGIFCTGSRNGLLVAILQLGLFCLVAQASRRVVLAALLGGVGLLGGAVLLGLGDRRISAWDWHNDPRLGVWAIALGMIRDRPWLGWGLGNFKFIYPDLMPNPEFKEIFHPHNLWLLLGCEIGLPAMVLLTLLVGIVSYQATRPVATGYVPLTQKGIWVGYLLAGFASFTYALFDVTFYDSRVNIINWVILSGLYQLPRLINRATPPGTLNQTDPQY